MAVKRESERQREKGGKEALVTIILEIKGLSAYSACSPPLQFGRRGVGLHREAD